MIKKIFIIICILLLSSCAKEDVEEYIQVEELDFIEPIRSIYLFDEISDELKTELRYCNGSAYKNYQFKMLGKDIYDDVLLDIYDNEVDLSKYDNVVFEVVSTKCEHCKKMILDNLKQMLNYDCKIIQYFDIGDKKDIEEFYKDIGIEIDDDMTIICHNDKLRDYIKDYLKMETYPTLIAYKDHKVSFNVAGQISIDQFDKFYELAFVEPINIDENIINLDRTTNDIENELSKDNLDKLKKLDNDQYTYDLSLKIMGKKIDYENISNSDSSVFINEVEDYKEFINEDLIVFYTYLKDNSETNKVDFINNLIENNSSYNYLILLNEGIDKSSNAYRNMNVKFKARASSMSSNVPDNLLENGMANYPTAVFIKKGVFTGAYSNVENDEQFKKAIDLFLSDNSIALKINN